MQRRYRQKTNGPEEPKGVKNHSIVQACGQPALQNHFLHIQHFVNNMQRRYRQKTNGPEEPKGVKNHSIVQAWTRTTAW
ncbi:hypothetical protein T265_00322 [Opisthorchis viverrini]|uniref:Uncharacterized protein n=1 Tax=Opisthorchis viverrini TaxID=6198 RepID=A0A075AJS2_OPIVI|nr:hypothetical protein T265_00322 [Opisthorchis viverrini]KER33879.1 hypothetical protein T265_00322 [Opisthorchis viverrini]